MTTLILGGTGFIGARIAHRLVENGERVVCLDVIPDAASVSHLRDKVTVLYGDVGRIEDVQGAIKAYRIDRLVDMAYVLNSESDQGPHTAVRVNAMGVSNAFEAARLLDVDRVVYASSIAVYGDQSLYGERPVTEQDMPAPTNLYGAAKLLNEYEAALYHQSGKLKPISVRIGVVSGHGRLRGQGMWAAQFASYPALGKPVNIPFGGNVRASVVYVDDVAGLFVHILAAAEPHHAIYNTGGENVSIEELTCMVRKNIPNADYSFGTGQLILPYRVDSTRAESEFGWKRRSMSDSILEHIAMARAAE